MFVLLIVLVYLFFFFCIHLICCLCLGLLSCVFIWLGCLFWCCVLLLIVLFAGDYLIVIWLWVVGDLLLVFLCCYLLALLCGFKLFGLMNAFVIFWVWFYIECCLLAVCCGVVPLFLFGLRWVGWMFVCVYICSLITICCLFGCYWLLFLEFDFRCLFVFNCGVLEWRLHGFDLGWLVV